MPIRIKCQCGKALSVKDEMAGKAIKCPGCAKVIRVPLATKPAAVAAPPEPASESLSDLFDEEGFSRQVAAVCPACAAEMAANAVLCTKCGYHKEKGQRLAAHQTPGVDIDHGTLALEAAKASMAKELHLQKEMIRKSGMPWWGLALVLFIGVSGVTIGTLTVNAHRRVDASISFNPMMLFYQLAGGACLVVAAGALLSLIVTAFKKSRRDGLLMFTILYIFWFCFQHFRETWRTLLTVIVVGTIGGALLAQGL